MEDECWICRYRSDVSLHIFKICEKCGNHLCERCQFLDKNEEVICEDCGTMMMEYGEMAEKWVDGFSKYSQEVITLRARKNAQEGSE